MIFISKSKQTTSKKSVVCCSSKCNHSLFISSFSTSFSFFFFIFKNPIKQKIKTLQQINNTRIFFLQEEEEISTIDIRAFIYFLSLSSFLFFLVKKKTAIKKQKRSICNLLVCCKSTHTQKGVQKPSKQQIKSVLFCFVVLLFVLHENSNARSSGRWQRRLKQHLARRLLSWAAPTSTNPPTTKITACNSAVLLPNTPIPNASQLL